MPETRDGSPESAPAGSAPPATVRFGAFTLDLRARKLRRDETPVPLPSRSIDALAYLVARRDRVVDKDEIVAAVWRDVAVTDDSLIHAVSVLRRALGDDPSHPIYIETVPRRGYRFVGAVELVSGSSERPSSAAKTGADPSNVGAAHAAVLSYAGGAVRRPSVFVIALTLVLIAALAVTFYRGGSGRQVAGAAIRLQQSAPPGTAIVSGGIVSPTGRHVAFVARDDRTGGTALWVRALDAPEPRPLPGTEDAAEPFWSPDGRSIAFFARGRLMATDISSDAVRAIAVMNGAPGGGSWGASGVIVFADWTTGLYAVDAAGGAARQLTQLDQRALDVAHAWPQVLPDGRRFLYHVFSADSSRSGVYAGSLDGAQTVRLLDRALAAAYAPPGFLLYVQYDMLLAEPFDASQLRLGGRPVILARDISTPSLNDGKVISGSRELLAFREGSPRQRLTWVNRAGTAEDELDVPASMFNFRLAPNGRHLLAASTLTDTTGLWLVDLARRESTRLEADGIAPLWSPDGEQIAFTSRGGLDVYVRRMGDAAARPLFTGSSTKVLNDWSPDSRHILYTEHDAETRLDVWRLPVAGGPPEPLLRSTFNEVHARLSPDGQWLAYASDQSGVQEVYVRRYPDLDDPQKVSIGGGAQPQWRADQQEIFYLSPDRSLMAASVAGADRVSFGAPRRLFRTSLGSGPASARDSYAVTADGRSFLVDARHGDGERPPITIVINWMAGLPGATQAVAGDTSRATALAAR
jgi:DNA-binding winged helix-turn-helix (wHTH) protein/Tol biopolymer transport system component